MARAKIKRGSTHVDMTAMCDVAFLLLTFFILVGQFKPSEAIEVNPPSSVSNKHAPQKDYFNVTINKQNQFYIDMADKMKEDVLEQVGKLSGINFSDADVKAFKRTGFVGVPLNQLNQFSRLQPAQLETMKFTGIPADSTNNQLQTWITAAVQVSLGKKVNFLIKADDGTKYTAFKKVLDAFQKNDIYKYNLVTNTKEIPEGSDLWKKNMRRIMGEENSK